MHVFAATSDTWGLSGPAFLGFYAAMAVVAVIATALARRALARSLAPTEAPALDDPDDVAYLHEGPELTVPTALSAMYVAGRIAPFGGQRVRAVGAAGSDAIRLSLGGTEDLDQHRVAHLAQCAEVLDAPVVNEHIAFVRAGGLEAGHLLPVPRTRDALDVLVGNVLVAQAQLPVPLALEPIAALFDWPDDEMDEAMFLTELLDRTGAWLLLDVANMYANATNRAAEPGALLARLPLERVAYVHVAGGGTAHEQLDHSEPPTCASPVR